MLKQIAEIASEIIGVVVYVLRIRIFRTVCRRVRKIIGIIERLICFITYEVNVNGTVVGAVINAASAVVAFFAWVKVAKLTFAAAVTGAVIKYTLLVFFVHIENPF